MRNTKIALVAGLLALAAGGTALAKTDLGTVKTPRGEDVPKVGVEGTVTKVSTTGRNEITVKEADGKEYVVRMGPRWYADSKVAVGDKVKVEGIEREAGEIGAWKLTKADGTVVTLRTEAGRPAWAGKGRGMGMGRGQGQGQGFVDANKDGTCDHQQ